MESSACPTTQPDYRVALRRLTLADAAEFIGLMANSRNLHNPWIHPPLTRRGFKAYLRRLGRNDHEGFVVYVKATHVIAGIINLNDIICGQSPSASLGYYAGAPFAGKGYMYEGLQLVIDEAFDRLRLHRLEANIQPVNFASLNLMRRCGFKREALMRACLLIEGAWRDHERWVLKNHSQGRFTHLPRPLRAPDSKPGKTNRLAVKCEHGTQHNRPAVRSL